jgi:hypothetical protein
MNEDEEHEMKDNVEVKKIDKRKFGKEQSDKWVSLQARKAELKDQVEKMSHALKVVASASNEVMGKSTYSSIVSLERFKADIIELHKKSIDTSEMGKKDGRYMSIDSMVARKIVEFGRTIRRSKTTEIARKPGAYKVVVGQFGLGILYDGMKVSKHLRPGDMDRVKECKFEILKWMQENKMGEKATMLFATIDAHEELRKVEENRSTVLDQFIAVPLKEKLRAWDMNNLKIFMADKLAFRISSRGYSSQSVSIVLQGEDLAERIEGDTESIYWMQIEEDAELYKELFKKSLDEVLREKAKALNDGLKPIESFIVGQKL